MTEFFNKLFHPEYTQQQAKLLLIWSGVGFFAANMLFGVLSQTLKMDWIFALSLVYLGLFFYSLVKYKKTNFTSSIIISRILLIPVVFGTLLAIVGAMALLIWFILVPILFSKG